MLVSQHKSDQDFRNFRSEPEFCATALRKKSRE